MTHTPSSIELLFAETQAAINETGSETPPGPETTTRERFYEMIVVALGSLFSKSPIAGQMFDRTTLNRVIAGMDDSESAALARRADDWIRMEGILTQTEGQRSYFLPLPTMAALSTEVSGILLGEMCEMVLKRYLESAPSEALRRCARRLASHFLILLRKS
jgi:hypothetical protein